MAWKGLNSSETGLAAAMAVPWDIELEARRERLEGPEVVPVSCRVVESERADRVRTRARYEPPFERAARTRGTPAS
jgi:hypothetical protein